MNWATTWSVPPFALSPEVARVASGDPEPVEGQCPASPMGGLEHPLQPGLEPMLQATLFYSACRPYFCF